MGWFNTERFFKDGAPFTCLRVFDGFDGQLRASTTQLFALLTILPFIKGKNYLSQDYNVLPSDYALPFEMHTRQFPVKLCFGLTNSHPKTSMTSAFEAQYIHIEL